MAKNPRMLLFGTMIQEDTSYWISCGSFSSILYVML